jgi:hypothetical protein
MATSSTAKPATAGAVNRLQECDRLGGAIKSKVNSGSTRNQPSPAVGVHAAADAELLGKINDAVKAANDAEQTVTTAQTELVSRSRQVGLLLLEAKKLHPKVADFEAFLKLVNGLKLSRAYDLLRLAGGRTTDAELKQNARLRKQKSRKMLPKSPPTPAPEKVSVTDPPVTESLEASAEQRKAVYAELETTQHGTDKAAKRSAHYLAEFIVACRAYLPKITIEADRQKALSVVSQLMTKPKAGAA